MSNTWRTFLVVWCGQLVSIIGTGLTSFALGVWVYQQTETVTPFALIMVAKAVPVILLSPYAGVLADQYSRRIVMIAADSVAALSSLALAFLFATESLMVWHIYIAVMIAASAEAFQVPAYQASVTVLVDKARYARANGLIQVGQAAAEILAPLLAGLLMMSVNLTGIFALDFLSFVIAVGTLASVRFPGVKHAGSGEAAPDQAAGFGEAVRFVRSHIALRWLLLFFGIIFFIGGFISAMVQPMVLAFTTADVLGVILSAAGIGFFIGGLITSGWDGPAKQVDGLLVFLMLFGMCITVMGLRPSAVLVGLCAFGAHFCFPFINAYNQAIWQRKVPMQLQGRVFALRHMLTRTAQVSAFLIAGPLADVVFNPMLAGDGPFVDSLGRIMGTGPGRGCGLIFALAGLMTVVVAAGGWQSRRLRSVEAALPDQIEGSVAHP